MGASIQSGPSVAFGPPLGCAEGTPVGVGRSLYFKTAARLSWPSAKTSASTVTVSPSARLAGKRPASISGMTASMTTRRRPSTAIGVALEGEAEIEKCAGTASWMAENGERLLADEPVESTATESYVRFQPLGVILAVMPWNFPFWQAFRAGLPALTAGNVMLLKHSSNVPQSALAIEEVFREAGVPEGVFQTLLIGSAAVGRIVSDHRVAGVTLTGSDKAGALVAETAGRALKKTVLELGGSDPFIVLADADLGAAAGVACRARNQNNGQSCIAAKRFIVEEGVADEFEKKFASAVAALKVGNPMDRANQVGPLARGDLVADLERQVDESVRLGARPVVGGK